METYVELLVTRKKGMKERLLVAATAVLAVLTAAFGLFINPLGLIAALILGAVTYFVRLGSDVEFEYLYLSKELTIDRVMSRSKRKRAATYDLERMEILAPVKSYHLDGFKNRSYKMSDYSSRVKENAENVYVMIYDGKEKILLEPNENMIKAIHSIAPRKVFTD